MPTSASDLRRSGSRLPSAIAPARAGHHPVGYCRPLAKCRCPPGRCRTTGSSPTAGAEHQQTRCISPASDVESLPVMSRPNGMVVEETARGQRIERATRRSDGADLVRRISRAGPRRATATEDDRRLRRCQPLDRLGHDPGIGQGAADLTDTWQDIVGLVGHVSSSLSRS